jgi:hypothetical protein
VAAAPADCTKLFRIVTPLVNQVNLIEDLSRFFQADAMFSFDVRLFSASNSKRITVCNRYISFRFRLALR